MFSLPSFKLNGFLSSAYPFKNFFVLNKVMNLACWEKEQEHTDPTVTHEY